MLKEQSMKNQFEARFLQEIEKINAALTKKGEIKKTEKANQRIGRALEKYPSMNKFYTIEVEWNGMAVVQNRLRLSKRKAMIPWKRNLVYTSFVPVLIQRKKKLFRQFIIQ